MPLVTLPAGAPVETGQIKDGWNEATVEGWIVTTSTERTRRDGYDLVVTPDAGENLRRSPNGPVVGRAREGTLLERVTQRGRWIQVRRDGWIPQRAITGSGTAEAGPATPAGGPGRDPQAQQPAAKPRRPGPPLGASPPAEPADAG
ncbi:MAG: hypothetical protein H0T86_04815, partial [Gemmatimonadales bacterium]|nr:hypothetical protein [Gemmatimonadales bacterium]